MTNRSSIWRLQGELLLQARANDHDTNRQAEDCFLNAIEIARRQQAKSWELRATTSLCRLRRQTGKSEEARTRLAEIYGWFTGSTPRDSPVRRMTPCYESTS